MLLVASKVLSKDKPVVGVNTDPERYNSMLPFSETQKKDKKHLISLAWFMSLVLLVTNSHYISDF